MTPRPTASTTPVTSQPTVSGSPNCAAAPLPARVFQSTGFTPAASTRTRTSVGSGSGTGRLSTSSTSGPPKLCCTIARMESMRWSYHAPAASQVIRTGRPRRQGLTAPSTIDRAGTLPAQVVVGLGEERPGEPERDHTVVGQAEQRHHRLGDEVDRGDQVGQRQAEQRQPRTAERGVPAGQGLPHHPRRRAQPLPQPRRAGPLPAHHGTPQNGEGRKPSRSKRRHARFNVACRVPCSRTAGVVPGTARVA